MAGDLDPFPRDQFPYLVLADRIEARIRRGEFGETGKLPSARELIGHYRVSLSVVTHARQELRRRGLIYSAGPHGTFTTCAPDGGRVPLASPGGAAAVTRVELGQG
jgi:DNA-binding transcriptional regulator YhcF (GntR family)